MTPEIPGQRSFEELDATELEEIAAAPPPAPPVRPEREPSARENEGYPSEPPDPKRAAEARARSRGEDANGWRLTDEEKQTGLRGVQQVSDDNPEVPRQ